MNETNNYNVVNKQLAKKIDSGMSAAVRMLAS